LTPLPKSFDYAEGAVFLAAHGTAYHALVDRAQLATGEVLLVHGAGAALASPRSNSVSSLAPR
jgi:NADPH2:quinone reductase